MRRRLMEFVKEIAGGEDVTHGSFVVTEETSEFAVNGLGFSPTSVIVCEDEFGALKKRTCAWILTDIISVCMRYNTETSITPSIFSPTVENKNEFLSILEDGFTIKQINFNYPIVAKRYNYIAW